MKIKISIISILSLILTSCGNGDSNEKEQASKAAEQSVLDSIAVVKAAEAEHAKVDGYLKGLTFATVGIGAQTWMKQNLNVNTFRNGDIIPEARTNDEWKEAGRLHKPAWCYYKNDPNSTGNNFYGKLYNWWAVTDERGLAPKGFHIPNRDECDIFLNYLGRDQSDQFSVVVGEKLLYEGGFNAVLGGFRYDFGSFNDIEKDNRMEDGGHWWTSSNGGCNQPPCDNMFAYYFAVNRDRTSTSPTSYAYNQNYGMSVRCITGEVNTMTAQKQAEEIREEEFRQAQIKGKESRLQEEKEKAKETSKTYTTDGQKCRNCGLGHYSDGFCGMCGAASGERVNQSNSNASACEFCGGTGYVTSHGIHDRNKLCPSCKGSGKQTY